MGKMDSESTTELGERVSARSCARFWRLSLLNFAPGWHAHQSMRLGRHATGGNTDVSTRAGTRPPCRHLDGHFEFRFGKRSGRRRVRYRAAAADEVAPSRSAGHAPAGPPLQGIDEWSWAR